MLSSNCAICDSKKSRYIIVLEASRLLTGLIELKSPFQGIPILGNII